MRRFLDIVCILFSFVYPIVTYIALTYPPVIASQGQAHRIFYIHVPVAWVALYAPIVSAVAGVLYIMTKKDTFDVWSLVATRISFLFALGVVISGPLWASTEWGTYWNWKDSRLMSFFILCLCLGGYFLLRASTENPNKQKLFAAVMTLFTGLASLATWFAIRWITPDTHPTSVLGKMAEPIRYTFWLSVLAYHIIFLILFRVSLQQERLKRILIQRTAS